MKRLIKRFSQQAALLSLMSGLAQAADKAGEFDYYVLALSWSPNWCALEGKSRNSEQCDASRDLGFVMHGLWPQYEKGYPRNCRSNLRDPSRAMTRSMADIMGTSGSAWYQWKKHGRCSGLDPQEYFGLAREAFGKVTRPAVMRQIESPMQIGPLVVEAAFLEENSELDPDEITITCRNRMLQEARICLTKDLEFRTCGRDIRRDCSASSTEVLPIE